jgi:hypothetical protein
MLQYDYDVVVLHTELRVSQFIDDIEVLLGIIVQRITDFTMSIETGGLQRGVSDKDYSIAFNTAESDIAGHRLLRGN